MQSAVTNLIAMGPLPNSIGADAEAIRAFQEQLSKIETPVSDEEASALAELFGPDDCFGLAWSLLHLIETSPGWPIESVLTRVGGQWGDQLRERAK